jgi:hypothetical protein
MKVLIFFGLIVALFAVRLTSHDYDNYEWVGLSDECADSLFWSISNDDGKLVVDKYEGGFQHSCEEILIDDRAAKCILYAQCRNR